MRSSQAARSVRSAAPMAANLRQIKRRVRVRFQKFFEACDDGLVTLAAVAHCCNSAFAKASDHQVNRLLFERPNDFGQIEKLGRRFGDYSDYLMKVQQPHH